MRLPLARLAVPLALLLAGCSQKKCPSGETDCAGTCLDLRSNPLACGGCNTVCPTGAACTDGQCRCPAGQTPCRGSCVDLQSDPSHCGSCDVFCGLGTCSAGACACDLGASPCPWPSPACVDLTSDPLHCGTCPNACPVHEACVSGVCQCLAPRERCPVPGGMACIDTSGDPANCGGCGNVCPFTNDVCVSGVCQCPAALPDACPLTLTCVNLQADALNCGTCGHVCPLTNDICVGGACACPASLPDTCTPTCVNKQTDELNCGTCGTRCAAGATCTSGACSCPASPFVVCGASGANPGQCCTGNDCCSGACQTVHSNGLGQSYYDCGSVNQHTLAQASLAAQAWNPGVSPIAGSLLPGCGGDASCLCSQSSAQAAIWCAAGSQPGREGRVVVTGSPNCFAATCPSASVGSNWN